MQGIHSRRRNGGGRTGEERSARALLLSGGVAPGRAEEGGGCIGMEGWSGAEREEQVDREEIPIRRRQKEWRRQLGGSLETRDLVSG